MFIFLQMYLTGIRRRKKEIRYVSIAIFSSVLFMSSVTLFQNCMDRYLIESNYQNYGDWVMSATKDYENSKIRFEELNHPYFEGVGVCKVAGNMVKRDGLLSDVCIGTADEAFFRLGSLTLCDGRMPEASDEIAMELSALSKLGYSYELGQTIRAAVEKDGAVPEKNYRLVGILKSYADNWNHKDSYLPPHCIVTEEGLSKLCGPSYETYYYRLSRDYENISMEEFTGAFLKPEYARAYNSYTYENRVWGSGMMFGTMKWVLVLAGALAVGYLMMFYASQRRKWYYRLRAIGAGREQIIMMIVAETACGVFPGAFCAMLLPYLPGALICRFVSEKQQLPSFFVFRPGDFAVQCVASFGILLFGALCAWIQCRDQNIFQNRHTSTGRQFKRIRRDAARERGTASRYLRREGMMHPFQKGADILFSCIVCTILMLCLNKVGESVQRYAGETDGLQDFSAFYKMDIRKDIYDKNGEEHVSVVDTSFDMYHGIGEELKEELSTFIGIERIEYRTWDHTHILQWENKKNSLIEKRKADLYEGRSNTADEEYWDMDFCFFEKQDPILQELEKEADLSGLNEQAFWDGKQVIVLFFGFYDIVSDSANRESYKKIQSDPTLKPGVSAKIVSGEAESKPVKMTGYALPAHIPEEYSLPGVVPVTVGAVINTDSERWDGKLPDSLYVIIGSQKLAGRIAQADGKILRENRILIDLNGSQSFESTQKRLTSVFQRNYMQYRSGFEKRRQEFHTLTRQLCTYGVLFLIILFLFLLIQVYFGQIQNERRTGKYRLLRQLGMEWTRLRFLCVKERFLQALWMVFSIPCCFLAVLAGNLLEQSSFTGVQGKGTELLSEGVYSWSELLQANTDNRFLLSFEFAARSVRLPYLAVVVAGLILALTFISYLSIRNFIKKEKLR